MNRAELVSGLREGLGDFPNRVWQEKIKSVLDGKVYSAWEYIASLDKRVADLATRVWQEKFKSAVDDKFYTAGEYIASIDSRVIDIQTRVRGTNKDVDSLQALYMGAVKTNETLAAVIKRLDELAVTLADIQKNLRG